MRVWRISNHASLDGLGGLQASARWHTRGRPIVYCAPNPATALLEVLVHAEVHPEDLPLSYRFLEIEIPAELSYGTADVQGLPEDWPSRPEITQEIGNSWLESRRSAVLFVPCVIVPETHNILINPSLPESAGIGIVRVHSKLVDSRLAKS